MASGYSYFNLQPPQSNDVVWETVGPPQPYFNGSLPVCEPLSIQTSEGGLGGEQPSKYCML